MLSELPGTRDQSYWTINGEIHASELGKNLVFRDSLQHLSSSLERLVESEIKVGLHKFKHLANIIKQRYGSSVDWKLLCRKGVFPYDY